VAEEQNLEVLLANPPLALLSVILIALALSNLQLLMIATPNLAIHTPGIMEIGESVLHHVVEEPKQELSIVNLALALKLQIHIVLALPNL